MAAPAAHALTGPPEPTSSALGNAFSLDHSDFENASNLGALSSSNASLSQGTGTTMLHNSSLKDVVPATGNTVWKQANGNEISVVPGATYRVGAYFHTPTVAGDTLTWAVGGYNSSGVWQGWTSGATDTLANTSAWQWVTSKIVIPTSVTNVIGVRVTITGTQAGDVIREDEASFSSVRPAVAIGFRGNSCLDGNCTSNTAADWLATNSTTPPGMGPGQANKEFYGAGEGLPVFGSSACHGIENGISDHTKWPVCIIAYKDQVSQATMTAFMNSVPADQQVVLVYHQEPEGDYASGSTFVSEFSSQYALYKAAGNFENVSMVMDSASYPYKNGKSNGCSYIVPATSTDGYLMDFYESTVDGQAMNVNVDRGSAWTLWLSCVSGNGRPIGVAEEGYAQNTTANQSNTVAAMRADNTYLSNLPDTITGPVMYRAYWDTNNGPGSGTPWALDNSHGAISEWQSELAQNGGY